ncbi:hypothetical protein N8I74_10970 [Chitiniphilus purpureus]|uniref:Uncharacterized protein n=1 Tax=Chitiniphilus purpureus TaxID=2981137 RepID=A0ABY6DHM6_9NEIS|nr:hypothetical protein [Chitiniphilus sp. CD1]UXY13844.1 hypothetical protein N8I74_10970 [Chitiniphilus sp. CD1]
MKDIDEIRRDNLRLIEAEQGSATMAARNAGMTLAQFLNLRDGAKDSKTGKPRGMRKETARKIEAGNGKQRGWLDIDHSNALLDLGAKAGANAHTTGPQHPSLAQEPATQYQLEHSTSPDEEAISREVARLTPLMQGLSKEQAAIVLNTVKALVKSMKAGRS